MPLIAGNYVTAERGGGLNGFERRDALMVNRTVAAGWEEIVIERNDDGTVSLRCPNGMYVSAEGGGGGALSTNRPEKRGWEKFTDVKGKLRCFDGVHFVRARTDLTLDAAGTESSGVTFRRLGVEQPPVPSGARPTRDQVLDVHANMISMRDRHGRVMLSWFFPSLTVEDQKDWLERWRAAGLTHVLLCPVMQYPGYWAPGGDLRGNPAAFAAVVTHLLDRGFIPVIEMTSGDGGSAKDITTYWPGLLAALAPEQESLFVMPGFEVVGPGGGWRSRDLSVGLEALHAALPRAVIGVHLQPERATGASYGGSGRQDQTPAGYVWHDYQDPANPGLGAFLEDDDPWHGDEAGFWRSHGGQYADALWYQTPHGSKLLDPNGGGPGIGDWEDRFIEILDRLGTGGRGWRQIRIIVGEKTGYDYFHDRATDADVVRTSNRAQQLAAERGVRVGFGDGGPSS